MGIKSFQGARADQKKEFNAPILVSDYMTKDLITFKPDQSVLEVMDILIKFRISGGPVVDSSGKLVGIISEGDCMKQISESRYYNVPMADMTVEKYMVKDVDTIDKDQNIFDTANLFYTSHRRRFPVLENGKLIGQISRKDVLKAALKISGQNWK
jgi:CBS domain-containing protein